ncbi:MAG: SDR family oxidoreductase [Acidobacteriota bacterium]|nr:SDR family oxidoreductase [Acidobacteriota bacterium]
MARQLRSLNGRVVAITGGARGIGRATAAALLAQGAKVAIGDLDAELCRQVAGELGAGAIGLPLDVTSRERFEGFLDAVQRELGPLDVLVNNAGIAPAGAFASETDAVTAHVLEVNLGGAVLGCKLAVERLVPRGTGHIVNIASALGRTAVPGMASYCASKFAIVGLSEALRAELDGSGVELHVILPGLIRTDMAAGVKGLRGIPTGSPDDVAAAVVDALRTGRQQSFVPRRLGWLVALQPITPPAGVRLLQRLLRADRLFTQIDALERAAYEARLRSGESG